MSKWKMRFCSGNMTVKNGETLADWTRRTGGGSGSHIEEPYVPRTLSNVLGKPTQPTINSTGEELAYVPITLWDNVPKFNEEPATAKQEDIINSGHVEEPYQTRRLFETVQKPTTRGK